MKSAKSLEEADTPTEAAEEIVDARYENLKVDRDVLAEQIAQHIPPKIFEKPHKHHRTNLVGLADMDAWHIAARAGETLKQIFLSPEPGKRLEEAFQYQSEKLRSRYSAIWWVRYMFDSEIDEPYTLEDLYREAFHLEVPDLLWEASITPCAAGACIKTAREIAGWTRVECGRRLGLTITEYNTSGANCQSLRKWEKGNAAPSNKSVRRLQRAARQIREDVARFDSNQRN